MTTDFWFLVFGVSVTISLIVQYRVAQATRRAIRDLQREVDELKGKVR